MDLVAKKRFGQDLNSSLWTTGFSTILSFSESTTCIFGVHCLPWWNLCHWICELAHLDTALLCHVHEPGSSPPPHLTEGSFHAMVSTQSLSLCPYLKKQGERKGENVISFFWGISFSSNLDRRLRALTAMHIHLANHESSWKLKHLWPASTVSYYRVVFGDYKSEIRDSWRYYIEGKSVL